MLSNLVVGRQKCIVIKDELGEERISEKFITGLLKEQGEDVTIKRLSVGSLRSCTTVLNKFLKDCNVKPEEEGKLWNVILPALSDLLVYQKEAMIFQFLHNLKKCQYVKRAFLWISMPHLQHNLAEYVVAACEHMSDLLLHILSTEELTLRICKPGGGVSCKHYTYKKTKSEFKVELKENADKRNVTNSNNGYGEVMEQLSTFKIELDEEEMVARNAMKMPYEKVGDSGSNIIYTPDSADDFDDEDPDEDLDI